MRHLLTLSDLTADEIQRIFSITEDLKSKFAQGLREPLLPGRVLALLFEKPSLRTRVSFEAGMAHLGGSSMMLGEDVGFGKRESVADFARVLSEMVDVIVVRAKRHATVDELAEHSACSVINGLTDLAHPCQALADLFTLQEHCGELAGLQAGVGRRRQQRGPQPGRGLRPCWACEFAVCTPPGYEFDEPISSSKLAQRVPRARSHDDARSASRRCAARRPSTPTSGPAWARKPSATSGKRDFADYQVNAKLMARPPDDAVFMHCLPAHRGEEVTDEVIDGPHSVVVAQAANRMHVQKGILVWLLAAKA